MAKISKKNDEKRDLAASLLQSVENHGTIGEGKSPLTLEELALSVGRSASDPLFHSALNSAGVKKALVIASQKSGKGEYKPSTSSLVALKGELDALARSPQLLGFCLDCLAKESNQAFTVVELRDALRGESLKKPFEQAINRHLAAGKLPPSFGAIKRRGKHYLFRLSDLVGDVPVRTATPPSSPPAHRVSFTDAFEAAFARLDKESGNRNYLKLLLLRQALPQFSREEFDLGLRQLRIAGRYSLDSSEERYRSLSDEEKAAGIVEGGTLLIYCSRV